MPLARRDFISAGRLSHIRYRTDPRETPAAVELTLFAVGGVNSGFCGRQGKDEPAPTGVHRGKIENVAKEGAVGLRVVAVEEDMGARNSRVHAGKSIKDR